MSNLISKTLEFFNNLFSKKNLVIFIMTVIIVLLILLNFKSCGDLKNQKAISQQNEEAMKNKLTVEKNKNGEYQTSIVAFEGTVKEVKKYNEELSKEIGDLKNRKPEVIIKTQLVYVGDTASVDNTLITESNGNYNLDWEFTNNDSSRIIKGTSSFSAKMNISKDNIFSLDVKHGKTKLTEDMFKIDLTVGVAKNKKTGFDEIFVTPKNPNIKIDKLEGAILNKPKQHYFSVGAQVGYGILYNKGNLMLGPYVGVGLSYNFFGKLFKK